MSQTPKRPSLLTRILVGDTDNSPLRKMLGDRPISDPASNVRKAARAFGISVEGERK